MPDPARFSSIDALRGLAVAAMLLVNNAGDWDHVYPWLEHAAWHGVTPADFIFPFFLLIVGVSLELAVTPKLERGVDPRQLSRELLWRGVRIFALGLALHLIAYGLIEGREFRLMGVLQRIGICFAVVGMLTIHLRSASLQCLVFATLLLAYWALLILGGSLAPDLNIVDRVDSMVLGQLAYSFNSVSGLAHEPEGLLSTLPSLATVLLGVRAGACLRQGQVARLWQFGLLALLAGALWSFTLPLNKQLWTSSFVLLSGGVGLLMIALAHQLIDVHGMPAVGKSFGVNAIAAYAGSWIVTCVLAGTGWATPLYRDIFAAMLAPQYGAAFASFAFAAAFTMCFAGLMRWMYRRGWRITI